MKFTISSDKLSKQLLKSQGAVATNPVLDILKYYKFNVSDGNLIITATDMETTVITSVPVESDEDFIFTIPAKTITDTVRSLPEQPVEFTYLEDEHKIIMMAGNAEYNMLALSTEDFPELPTRSDENKVKIKSGILIDAFSKTAFATSTDEVREAMQGIFVEIDFNNITFVATDAHKLIKFTYSAIHSDVVESFILPKKSALLVRNVFNTDEEVTMYIMRKNVYFVSDENQLVCRLIDATFPDYNTVIPADNPNHMIIDRKSLLNTLKRIIIFANQSTHGVTFDLSENSVKLTAKDVDFSNEAEDVLPCQFNDEALKIGYSGKFLIEMLSNIESDEVKFKMSTPNRPSLLVPEDSDKDNVDLVMLLMPLVIQRL